MSADFIRQKLSELSDEELLALEQELIKKKREGFAQAGIGAVQAGAEAVTAESRRLLPTQLNILTGRDVGPAAEAIANGADLETFEAKERIKSGLSEERTRRLLGQEEGGFKPTGFTSGGVKFEKEETEDERRAKREEELEILKAKEEVKAGVKKEVKTEAGERQARISLSVIGGSAQRLAQRYVDGFTEGGIGNIAKSLVSSGAQKIGGKVGDKFKHSGAFPGQKVELITKLMPILTQQGEKPGSVRLVTTVFDRLMESLPNKVTGPETAKEMISATLSNMFTFANAIRSLGITNEQVEELSENELKKLGDRIESFASEIRLSAEEQQDLESLLQVSLEPLSRLITQQGGAQVRTDIARTPSPQEIDEAERRGAVGFDTDKGVFVDANGNQI